VQTNRGRKSEEETVWSSGRFMGHAYEVRSGTCLHSAMANILQQHVTLMVCCELVGSSSRPASDPAPTFLLLPVVASSAGEPGGFGVDERLLFCANTPSCLYGRWHFDTGGQGSATLVRGISWRPADESAVCQAGVTLRRTNVRTAPMLTTCACILDLDLSCFCSWRHELKK